MSNRLPCLGVLGLALVWTTATGADQKGAVPKLYVTNSAGANIHVIDAARRQEASRMQVGKMPRRLVVADVPK
jgi:YVTN family beta-propeller protein